MRKTITALILIISWNLIYHAVPATTNNEIYHLSSGEPIMIPKEPEEAEIIIKIPIGTAPYELNIFIPNEYKPDMEYPGDFKGVDCFGIRNDSAYFGYQGGFPGDYFSGLKRFSLTDGSLIYNSVKLEKYSYCIQHQDGFKLINGIGDSIGFIDATGAYRKNLEMKEQESVPGYMRLDEASFSNDQWIEAVEEQGQFRIFKIHNFDNDIKMDIESFEKSKQKYGYECNNMCIEFIGIIDETDYVIMECVTNDVFYRQIMDVPYLDNPYRYCVYRVKNDKITDWYILDGVSSDAKGPGFDIHDRHLYYLRYYKNEVRLMRMPLPGEKTEED